VEVHRRFLNLLMLIRSERDGAYTLKLENVSIPVYCHMTHDDLGPCKGGGWSLVMKIDGKKEVNNIVPSFLYKMPKAFYTITCCRTISKQMNNQFASYLNSSYNHSTTSSQDHLFMWHLFFPG